MIKTVNTSMSTPDGVQWVRQLRETASGTKRRKLQLILESLTLTFLRSFTADLDSNIDSETKKSVYSNYKLESIPFLISKEPNGKRRGDLERVYGQLTKSIDPLRWEKIERLQQASRVLGYQSYPAMVWDIWEIDGSLFLEECKAVINTTKAQYQQMLKELYEYCNGFECDLRYCDWLYLRTRLINSSQLNKVDIERIAFDCINYFGLSTPRLLSIQLGSTRGYSDWDTKESRAAIFIPDEHPAYHLPVILHEVGHIAEGCNRSVELEEDFLNSVDIALSEAWAFLFEALSHQKDWLDRINICEKPDFLFRVYSIWSAYWARKYAANILYMNDLFEKGKDIIPEYSERMLEATGLIHDQNVALTEMDEMWRDVAYLRGYALAQYTITKLKQDDSAKKALGVISKVGPKGSIDSFVKNLGGAYLQISLAGFFGTD